MKLIAVLILSLTLVQVKSFSQPSLVHHIKSFHYSEHLAFKYEIIINMTATGNLDLSLNKFNNQGKKSKSLINLDKDQQLNLLTLLQKIKDLNFKNNESIKPSYSSFYIDIIYKNKKRKTIFGSLKELKKDKELNLLYENIHYLIQRY